MQLGTMQWGTLEYIFAIFAIATAIGVLLQAGILLGFFIAFVKLQGKLEKILSHVTEHALPMIERSKVMLGGLVAQSDGHQRKPGGSQRTTQRREPCDQDLRR